MSDHTEQRHTQLPFNKPYLTGRELIYIQQALESLRLSGDGIFTKKCQDFFEKKYGFKKTFLTTSGTDALEMAAILLDISPGDEIIAPSFTFVSTVNAFVLRGAKIVFADSYAGNPNIDASKIESLITSRTKAIIPVHYAGAACDMDKIMEIAEQHNLYVVEDAALGIDSYYTTKKNEKKPLGSIGHMAAFSFHETKNITAGEGGMLVINDERFIKRAEIIREKGTNRSAFFRGEIDKYGWVDIGSSFLPSDIIAAFLYAQLECLDYIQEKRKAIWNTYHEQLAPLRERGKLSLPDIPARASNNAHIYYIVCKNLDERTRLITHLKDNHIAAVFHYLSLHKSPFYKKKYEGPELIYSDHFSNALVRLPLFVELGEEQQQFIIDKIAEFYQ